MTIRPDDDVISTSFDTGLLFVASVVEVEPTVISVLGDFLIFFAQFLLTTNSTSFTEKPDLSNLKIIVIFK